MSQILKRENYKMIDIDELLEKEEYDVPEASKIWGVSPQAVIHRLNKEGKPELYSRRKIKKEEVKLYLEEHPFAKERYLILEYVRAAILYYLPGVSIPELFFESLGDEIKGDKDISVSTAFSEFEYVYKHTSKSQENTAAKAPIMNTYFKNFNTNVNHYTSEIIQSLYAIQKAEEYRHSNHEAYNNQDIITSVLEPETIKYNNQWSLLKAELTEFIDKIDAINTSGTPGISSIKTYFDELCLIVKSTKSNNKSAECVLLTGLLIVSLILIDKYATKIRIVGDLNRKLFDELVNYEYKSQKLTCLCLNHIATLIDDYYNVPPRPVKVVKTTSKQT